MSPKTPAKRKEPEGPTMYVTAEKAYANEHREEYKKKHPDKESKEITKDLKAAYEALSDEVKKPYEDAAAKDKQRYIEEMKAVRGRVQRASRTRPLLAVLTVGDTAGVQAGLETQDEKKAKAAAEREAKKAALAAEKEAKKAAEKAAKEAEKKRKAEEKAEEQAAKGPKKALSAYFFYALEVREVRRHILSDARCWLNAGHDIASQEVKAKLVAEQTDPAKKVTFGEIGKVTGAQWKQLSAEDKAPYIKKNEGTLPSPLAMLAALSDRALSPSAKHSSGWAACCCCSCRG